MDVAAVRAEIKAWERDFRASNGRDPSIQEIKDQPHIAAKYKLYKSLSKAASGLLSQPARSSTPPPSAPRQPLASSIIPKARAVKVDPPLSTSNPFSPVKNRKKYQPPASSSQRASNQSHSNPFATPSKPKNKPHVHPRSPSPDPFPLIEPRDPVQPPPLSPAADSAVTRARKRLRGEHVSPSPVKGKRARVASQAALSFTGRAALLNSPDTSDGDDSPANFHDTIIADTPMKPHTRGKNFKALFDDSLTNGGKRPLKPLPSSQKKAALSVPGSSLKRERSRALVSSSDEDDDWSVKPKLKSLEASVLMPVKSGQSRTRIVNGKRSIPGAVVPIKDDLRSDVGPSNTSRSKASNISQSQSATSNPSSRAINKRAFPDDLDDANDQDITRSNTLMNLPLIPPSPPPPDASKPSGPKYAEKGKGKGKGKLAPFGRKKAKLLQDAEGADDDGTEILEDDEVQVRELDPLAQLPSVEHTDDAGSDWETHWRSRQELHDSPSLSVDPGRFEVNLPDELQRVLAISPGGHRRETEEEKVVREVLYGSRETHYDPSKGGEIWDVGEESERGGGTEEEWEGEPVAWEVAEL